MKLRINSFLITALLTAALPADSSAQSAALTYQGRLTSGNAPANGRYDMQFILFAVESGGSPSSDTVSSPGVGVTNGLFTVALDFGADAFTGTRRWLDIAVREAGGGVFTALNPRQPITPAPLALTAFSAFSALSVPGVDGYSLHSSDGSITNALFVDGGGEVGLGTTEPAARLHVVSTPGEVFPPRIESTGIDRFSAGLDFYHTGAGKGYVGVPDANAPIAPGELILFGGVNTKASLWGGGVRGLTVDADGNVRLGATGQLHATSGEENLRIVRGVIDGGNIIAGSGFSVSRNGVGAYEVTFDPPFTGAPTVTATVQIVLNTFPADVKIGGDPTRSRVILLVDDSTTTTKVDRRVQFIAIGPR